MYNTKHSFCFLKNPSSGREKLDVEILVSLFKSWVLVFETG